MGRVKSAENKIDPSTGKPLSPGVDYRGPAQYRVRKLVDGKTVTKTFETDKLAREWREEKEAEVRKGTFVDRRVLDKTSLSELIERYELTELKVGGRRRGAAEDLGHIPSIKLDAIGSLPLSKLTPFAVRGFRDRQQKKYEPATVVKRLNLLAGILSHAIAEWDIPLPENPAKAKAVKRPEGADVKRERRLRQPKKASIRAAIAAGEEPPKHEEDILLDAVKKSEFPDDAFVVRLAIAQAMRQGEILALRWDDVDFDAKVIAIRGRHGLGPKTAKHQKSARKKAERGWEYRPLVPEAIEILMEKLGDRTPKPGELIFSVGGSNAFKVRIGRIISRAGLEDLTFHDLRHEATSRLAKRYKNHLDLARVTGHKDIKSLNRYYQPDLTELAEMTAAD